MRKEIKEFAEEMERVMQENDAKKVDSWKSLPIQCLEDLLLGRFEDYQYATEFEEYKFTITGHKRELINIANICMMLWHRYKEEENDIQN